jgi:hypothetical protein
MKRIVDKEEMRVHWQLSAWYEKTAYVLGVVTLALYALAFLIGIITGIWEL